MRHHFFVGRLAYSVTVLVLVLTINACLVVLLVHLALLLFHFLLRHLALVQSIAERLLSGLLFVNAPA
jgi:hypothetical protein